MSIKLIQNASTESGLPGNGRTVIATTNLRSSSTARTQLLSYRVVNGSYLTVGIQATAVDASSNAASFKLVVGAAATGGVASVKGVFESLTYADPVLSPAPDLTIATNGANLVVQCSGPSDMDWCASFLITEQRRI